MTYEPKRCKECGELFIPKTSRQKYCNKNHYRPCPVCGKPVLVKYFSEPTRTCSKECTIALKRKTCLEKYGCEDPGNRPEAKEKRKQTCLQKYGVENPVLNSNISSRIKETFQRKYGVDNISQLEETRTKVHDAWRNMTDDKKYQITNNRKQKWIDKYGVDNPQKAEEIKRKTKKTLLDKYGVDCSLKIPEAKEKSIQTMLSKYGTLNVNSVESVRNKARQTCKQRYGVPYYQSTEECKHKVNKTSLERYGCIWPGQSEEVIQKRINTNIDRYGVPAAFMLPEHQDKLVEGMRNSKHSRISDMNREFRAKLQSLGVECELEFKIENFWYDIVIPDRDIVIEIDPSITHSCYKTIYNAVDKNYHKNKTEIAYKNGYRCIHIFDWDDKDKILDMLVTPTRLFARSCTVDVISDSDAESFLNWNHIQGSVRNQTICLGLFDKEDELISVMTFGSPRYTNKYQWELLRFASKRGYQIVGGASKLFNCFQTELDPESVISYCNLSKFTGNIYTVLGFQHLRNNTPGKWWSKSGRVISDALLRQRGYDQLFHTNYGKGTSNEELMIKNWWLPVYDCGQAVYTWKKEA